MPIVGATLLAACSPTSTLPAPAPSPRFGLDQLSGVMFVLAGTNGLTLDVFKVQLHPFKVTQITHSKPNRGIDAVLANSHLVAVSSSDSGEARVGRLSADGTVQAFPGFQDPIAGVTQLLADGRIAYSARSYPYGPRGLPMTSERIYDPATQTTMTTLADASGRVASTYSPGLDLAYANMAEALIRHADGRETVLVKPVPRGVGLEWGPSNEIAVLSFVDQPNWITILRPDGTRIAHLEGYRMACWSPDGSMLVVLRDDGALYVWRPADGTQVYKIGNFPAGTDLANATWAAADPFAGDSSPF